ncbi:hypothetical protein [Planktothricoides raciborskii]|uniref:Uncharacterized protein n=1 Tax=Planktothricoides raciborskii GIHE-MW2 TaxID=2792601 RepID=A0AAU8JKP2_9CYAN
MENSDRLYPLPILISNSDRLYLLPIYIRCQLVVVRLGWNQG